MDIPGFRPPTDNLYKFVALSGVALVLITSVLLQLSIQDLSVAVIDATSASDVATLMQRASLDEVAAYQEELEEVLAQMGSPETFEGLSELTHRSDSLASLMKAANLENGLALIEVDAALQRVDQAKYASGVATTNTIVGIILGFPLAVFGFWAWYVKLQRPMDDLLAAQLATEKREDGPSPPSQ